MDGGDVTTGQGDPDPLTPARLYRALGGLVGTDETMEEIGSGTLERMVRLVLTDPDGEFWPYRISIEGQSFDGKAILALDQRLRGE